MQKNPSEKVDPNNEPIDKLLRGNEDSQAPNNIEKESKASLDEESHIDTINQDEHEHINNSIQNLEKNNKRSHSETSSSSSPKMEYDEPSKKVCSDKASVKADDSSPLKNKESKSSTFMLDTILSDPKDTWINELEKQNKNEEKDSNAEIDNSEFKDYSSLPLFGSNSKIPELFKSSKGELKDKFQHEENGKSNHDQNMKSYTNVPLFGSSSKIPTLFKSSKISSDEKESITSANSIKDCSETPLFGSNSKIPNLFKSSASEHLTSTDIKKASLNTNGESLKEKFASAPIFGSNSSLNKNGSGFQSFGLTKDCDKLHEHNNQLHKSSNGTEDSFKALLEADGELTETATKKSALLTEIIETSTGEEEEKTVHSAYGKLYVLTADKGYVESGKGNLKLNVKKDNHKDARFIMRSEGVMKVLLNTKLFAGMKIDTTGKFLRFSTFENSKIRTYLFKPIQSDGLDKLFKWATKVVNDIS